MDVARKGTSFFLFMTLLHFIVLGFATWNIASLLVQENGPANIFVKIRHRVGVIISAEGYPYAENQLGELFTCVWCMSRWVGLLLLLFYWLFPQVSLWFCAALALSTVAIWVNEQVAK